MTGVDITKGTITRKTAEEFMQLLDAARRVMATPTYTFPFDPGMEQPVHLTSAAFIDNLAAGLDTHGYDLHREPAEPGGWWVTWTKREGV